MRNETFFNILVILLVVFAGTSELLDAVKRPNTDALTLGVAELIRREEQRAHESCMADGLMAGYCPQARDVEEILKALRDGRTGE